eukprot:13233355-Alexandrium_andersonii.AAC.1
MPGRFHHLVQMLQRRLAHHRLVLALRLEASKVLAEAKSTTAQAIREKRKKKRHVFESPGGVGLRA